MLANQVFWRLMLFNTHLLLLLQPSVLWLSIVSFNNYAKPPPDRATRLGRSPHLSCKRDLIKLRDYMDRRVTAPKRVTSPTWDPSPPCKQALTAGILYDPRQFSRVCACLFQLQCFASPHYKFDGGA